MRTRTLLLFLVYSMPKVEISSPKQMPLIPQTKWVYHVYLCVFFWFSELKQIGSATTNAKGPHQLFFCLCLFVICFAFLLEFACAFVCFFYFCVVVNIGLVFIGLVFIGLVFCLCTWVLGLLFGFVVCWCWFALKHAVFLSLFVWVSTQASKAIRVAH